MSEAFRNQLLGFKPESTYNTDPITNNATEYWQYGKYTVPMGDLPYEIRELIQSYTGAQVGPADTYFSEYHTESTLSATAVNAIEFYMAMGKVSNSGVGPTYTHKIEQRDLGTDLPSRTHRSEHKNNAGTNQRYYSMPGFLTRNLVYAHDFSRLDRFSTYQVSKVGTRIEDPQFAAAHTTGPVIPGGHDLHYLQEKGTFDVKWNGNFTSGVYDDDASGDDLSTIIQNFQVIVANQLRPDKPSSQDYPDQYIHGNQSYILSFDILDIGASATALWDDFKTMQDNTTKMGLHYKIWQDDTHYLQIDLTDSMMSEIKEKYVKGSREDPVLRAQALMETMVVTAVDPLEGATYYA